MLFANLAYRVFANLAYRVLKLPIYFEIQMPDTCEKYIIFIYSRELGYVLFHATSANVLSGYVRPAKILIRLRIRAV